MQLTFVMSRLLLLFFLFALYVERIKCVEDDDEVVPVVLLDSRRITSSNADRYDEREARMALPTESPGRSRRERSNQRRRKAQVATRRSGSSPRRRVPAPYREPGDLLEMQESQNGLYVTVPEHNDTTHEIVIQTLTGNSPGPTTISRRNKARSTSTTTASSVSNVVVGSLEYRGKKTVAMPASLYNHFRPVESNIPIEDMSQFLYFGQKLQRGKDGAKMMMMMASPSPKKLLAGLSDILDDDMNSVDRGGASKSTKMRTTSLREHTTRPTESANSTTTTTSAGEDVNNDVSSSLRIVVTVQPHVEESRSKQHQSDQPQQRQRISSGSSSGSAPGLRNSSEQPSGAGSSAPAAAAAAAATIASSSSSSSSSTTAASPSSSSSSSTPAAAVNIGGSAGATVEQATAPPPPRSQHSPGFTIRWTDARASKRRRIVNNNNNSSTSQTRRRQDKSARQTTMDESVGVVVNVTTTTTTPSTSTSTEPAPASDVIATTTTTEEEEEVVVVVTTDNVTTTVEDEGQTTVRMLDPSEVQKMYRSSTTTTTTTTPEVEQSVVTPEVPAPVVSTTTESVRVSAPERSPEVRARNLADKAKDDVLPIMQRFNTSLFNETTVGATTTATTTTTTGLPPPPPSVVPTVTTAEPTTTTSTSTSTTTTTRPRSTTNRTRPPNTGGYYPLELGGINRTGGSGLFEPVGYVTVQNVSEVTSRRHDADALASQETIVIVSYILATLLVFPIAVGVGLILRRLILRNRKVLEESDTSSEISCRKDALSLETGDYKMPIEKTMTKLPRIQHLCHEVEKPPPPTSQESRWEFPRDKLRLQTVLGEGNFGQVWKAEADDLSGHQGTTRLVAVKTVKEGAADREKEDLVRELEIMQRVGSHPNVVTLLGCCTEQEPHYLILEYVMYGKLLTYLRDHRTRQDFYNFSEDSAALTSRDLTVFGYCVARGMEYLASKKIIHRDLAARNVLVDHNKLCKIADFGMSRFANEDGEVVEARHGRNALPIRWMAPESLIYSLFTTKTDVWSFGILMWEIVTLGSTPYPDMTAREVMRSVQSGYRLERPSHCRGELFRVVARCWHADPDRRPEFQVLRRDLAQLLEDNMNGHYVDLESFASECTD